MTDNNDTTLRPIQAAKDAGREAIERGRGQLIEWLPDAQRCEACNARCEATTGYVQAQAEVLPIWECPQCERRYHRDAGNPLSFDMWNR